jgi:hypothetical protein
VGFADAVAGAVMAMGEADEGPAPPVDTALCTLAGIVVEPEPVGTSERGERRHERPGLVAPLPPWSRG